MAIVCGKYLRGIVGPVVFRVAHGRQIVSSKKARGTVKQTVATKRAGHTFGLASKLGSFIRSVFQPLVKGFQDKTMHSRLAAELCLALGPCRNPDTSLFSFSENSFRNMEGFDFNSESPLKKSLGMKPDIALKNGLLKVSFPASDTPILLKFPKQASSCEMRVGILLFQLDKSLMVQQPEWQAITIKKENKVLNGRQFTFTVPNGCMCVVSLFLRFHHYTTLLNNKQFSPAGICSALISPGSFEETNGHFWVNMQDLKFY